MNITPKLTHTAQCGFVKKSGGGYKDTSITSVATVKCYCYYDTRHRMIEGTNQAIMIGWTVIFPTSFTSLAVGDIITNVIDKRKHQILQQAKVTDIIVYRHYRKGDQFRQAILKLN